MFSRVGSLLQLLLSYSCRPTDGQVPKSKSAKTTGLQPDESPCTHLVVLLPEDVGRRLWAVDEAGEVEAGRVVHVQLVLAQDLRARLWKKQCKWINHIRQLCMHRWRGADNSLG